MNQNGHIQHHKIAIIGAGPVGIEMAVSLKRLGVPYIQFDANQVAHTISWWPRNTNFFSTTERVAIAGVPIQNNHQQRITGEDYLAYLRGVIEQFDLTINTFEPVVAIEQQENDFLLTTQTRTGTQHYSAEKVIIAIGDMHTANHLGIPGEDLPFVTHYFNDPHDYFQQRLLIVGGRNSAVEAALRCWRVGADVTIVHRRPDLDRQRVKHWLLPDLEVQIEDGNIAFMPSVTPIEIRPDYVALAPCDAFGQPLPDASIIKHPTDFVFFATGHRGDQSLLKMAGIELVGENRVPVYDQHTMESNIPNIYLVGTVAAGVQQRYTIFIENSHEHVAKVAYALTGKIPPVGTVAQRSYEMAFEQFEAN